ncbi:transcription antitermination factor NusB [Paenibacillus chartarius]|uniref:Transcription antitermination protein NusB n=1 Tax=Paenibacillus chartarius TaxID=747481 RepID=A0ABV6DNI6_9BACL
MRRRVAREIAVQSLYQIEMNEVSVKEAVHMALEEARNDNEAGFDVGDDKVPSTYVQELVEGTRERLEPIDQMLSVFLKGWQMDRLSRVDREVLRLAAYEMVYRDDVPPKVALNEAIEIAKHFGTEESGKFVNGVLGKMIKDIDELKQKYAASGQQS